MFLWRNKKKYAYSLRFGAMNFTESLVSMDYMDGQKIPYSECRLIRPQGYKTFFILNSGGHEIFSANKYENINNSQHFHIY